MGQALYPNAYELIITADCGGSNSYRAKLGKWELQQLATEVGLTLQERESQFMGMTPFSNG